MDGRVLPILLGATGHPPKTYRIPVPDAHGGPPTVLVYRRVPRGHSKRLGIVQGWTYLYAPEGEQRRRPKWPWSRGGGEPHATPTGKPDDAEE
jgi:hypothetical protein